MTAAEAATQRRPPAWRELVRFLPELARLLWAVSKDPRVSWRAKAVAAGAVAYVVWPVDLIPDRIPVLGRIDDVLVIARALRFLFRSAGYEVLREHWDGTDEGFALLMMVAGVHR